MDEIYLKFELIDFSVISIDKAWIWSFLLTLNWVDFLRVHFEVGGGGSTLSKTR